MLKAVNTMAWLAPMERKAFNLDLEIDVKDLSDEQVTRLLGRTGLGAIVGSVTHPFVVAFRLQK